MIKEKIKMKKCLKCGHENGNDALFCNRCGEKLDDVNDLADYKETNMNSDGNLNQQAEGLNQTDNKNSKDDGNSVANDSEEITATNSDGDFDD